MARPREFDREVAIETAMLVFWREGFPGASVEQLCEAIGVGSSSFYKAFGSKELLFRETVGCYLDSHGRRFWDELAGGESARKGMEAFLSAAATLLPATDTTPGGCMVALGAVSETWPTTVFEVVRTGRIRWTNLIRQRLEAAIARGELPDRTDVGRWSRFYMATYQGMAAQARDGATSNELRDVASSAMAAWPEAA